MRSSATVWALIWIAGCAARETPRERETAPYKAVVVFQWLGGAQPTRIEADGAGNGPSGGPAAQPAPVGPTPARAGQLEPERVEEEILSGLDEYRVLSDFIPATWTTMHSAAVREKADLIVLIRIGSLVEWDEASPRIVPGLAVLDGLLWIATGVGGWWVPDQEF